MHYIIVVVVSKEITGIEDFVENSLAPYDEALTDLPHRLDCFCIEASARRIGEAETARAIGKSRDELQTEYRGIPEDERPEWDEFAQDFELAVKEYTIRARALRFPDPTCFQCNGTGAYITCVNEQGYWDWWEFGRLPPAQESNTLADNMSTVVEWCKSLEAGNDVSLPNAILTLDREWLHIAPPPWRPVFPMSTYRWRKVIRDYLNLLQFDDLVVWCNMHT